MFDFSDGPFCRIEIVRSYHEGVRTWGVRDVRHRVEPAHVRVNTLTSENSFKPCWYQGATRQSWYGPSNELK